jgi:hypothetical protein
MLWLKAVKRPRLHVLACLFYSYRSTLFASSLTIPFPRSSQGVPASPTPTPHPTHFHPSPRMQAESLNTAPLCGTGDHASGWLPPDEVLASMAAAAACPSGASSHDLCADTAFASVVSALEPGPDDWDRMACMDLARPAGVWEDDLPADALPFGSDEWAALAQGCTAAPTALAAAPAAPGTAAADAAGAASPAGCGVDRAHTVCDAPSVSHALARKHADTASPAGAATARPGPGAGVMGGVVTGVTASPGARSAPDAGVARRAPPVTKASSAHPLAPGLHPTHHRVAAPIARPRKAAKEMRRKAVKKMRRKVSSPTALRLLYITKGMHRALGLDDMYPRPLPGRRGSACTIHMTAAGATVDGPFPVTMTTSTFKGHAHRRFSAGWREFCAAAGVQVGDTITFSRGRVAGHLTVAIDKVAGKGRP